MTMLQHLRYVELRWIEWGLLFHLLQEYARHLGRLDIVAELAGGPVGE